MEGFRLVVLPAVLLLLAGRGAESSAGFIKSPLSEVRLPGESVELHCEAIGRPIPEIQWWFEADYNNESFSQLWDGAREDRVQMNTTYIFHATSTLYLFSVTTEDSGTYECRASNDPDRNHLTRTPRIKWIRSQANVMVVEHPQIHAYADGSAEELLTCQLNSSTLPISGHQWLKGKKVLHTDEESSDITVYNITEVNAETSGQYTCVFLTPGEVQAMINVSVPPSVVAYKASEHGNEGDTGVLTCKSNTFPLIEQWMWYKVPKQPAEPTPEVIVNGTERFTIKSSGNKTELRIHNLDIEKDEADYICNGTNYLGTTGAVVTLHVRSRLAALWPFLGIVAEVLILVTIIFIYEKRRKPDDVPEDEDGGSAPLKSNAGANHDTVRQRNSS